MEEEEGNGGKEVALLMVFRKSKCCKCGRYPLAERRREFGRVWFRVRCSCGARTDWATDIYGRRREKAKARAVQHWELINKPDSGWYTTTSGDFAESGTPGIPLSAYEERRMG